MKKLLSTVLLLGFVCGLSACNTIAGAGKDVQKAGQKVEQASENCQSGRTC